jgi:hypothetical protein
MSCCLQDTVSKCSAVDKSYVLYVLLDVGLLGCNAVPTSRYVPAKQPSSSALKMEAVYWSEMFVSVFKSTQCYNPQDQH